ncbi:hypothetical protein GCM10010274_65080 [Streptomyces lavendofoliae]|uniref:Uncharacterized protein n=1 Tax=Streptomyces lavendofoliae TaxID=67314 RepID=A0A918I617_9ACTN|nr:hypothetical protein GCM10010274_65080 [Streptomyces lavendofoliae]
MRPRVPVRVPDGNPAHPGGGRCRTRGTVGEDVVAAGACLLDQAGSGSGVRCVRMRGGGGTHRGAWATDDNAADARAGAHEPGKIRKTRP